MFDRILIAHDGSDIARKAFDVAVEITAKLGAHLRLICVEEDIPRHAEVIDEYREEKDRSDSYFGQLAEHCRARAAMRSVDLQTVIVPGHAVKVIGDFIRSLGDRLHGAFPRLRTYLGWHGPQSDKHGALQRARRQVARQFAWNRNSLSLGWRRRSNA